MVRILLAAMLIGQLASGTSQASSIVYAKVKLGRLAAHTVTVDLHNPQVRVSVAIARKGRGYCESFKSLVGRARPDTAVTGTFFDTRTLIPTGDIALFGTVVHSGCIGSALCVDTSNRASIVPLSTGRRTDWAGYETVLCAGPTLISGGRTAIALKHEGFRRSLHSRSRRTAVGITKAGKLLIAVINRKATLYETAKLMLKLNVLDGVCLDGGSSTALYDAGRYLAMPSRGLTNCLVVYASAEAYQRSRTELAPAALFAKSRMKTIASLAALQPAPVSPVSITAPDPEVQ